MDLTLSVTSNQPIMVIAFTLSSRVDSEFNMGISPRRSYQGPYLAVPDFNSKLSLVQQLPVGLQQ